MKKAVLAVMVAAFAVAMVSTNALAKGSKGDKGTEVKGAFALVKNDKGEVTGATITTKSSQVYTVVTAGLTQDLTALDGKDVIAHGDVKDDAGKMSLTVKGEIKAAAAKKEKAK